MTTNEIKWTLFKKLQDEETYFSLSDISVRKSPRKTEDEIVRYEIRIKEYEHIRFFLSACTDVFEGYFALVTRYTFGQYDGIVTMLDGRQEPPVREALIDLGYHIGTRF